MKNIKITKKGKNIFMRYSPKNRMGRRKEGSAY